MPPTTPFSICSSCLRALSRTRRGPRYLTTSSVATSSPASARAKLTNRRVLEIHGLDASKFLQGLVTNNISVDGASTAGTYAAFLTAQGKVLNDVFIYTTANSSWQSDNLKSDEPGYLIDVDGAQALRLMQHLKRHKLRAKLKIRLLDEGELDVWSVWRKDEPWTKHTTAANTRAVCRQEDRRAPGMGQRVLIPSEKSTQDIDGLEDLVEGTLDDYNIRRYFRGVPEGQNEIPHEDALPMNYNIDLMGGIDFKKGCYVGQELTIRTHHTGVVRRRVLPVVLYDNASEQPERQTYDASFNLSLDLGLDIRNDTSKKRSTGRLIASVGNIGLAICRLEQMTDLNISAEGGSYKPGDKFIIQQDDVPDIGVKPFVPDWIRSQIRGPRVQKRVE